MRRLIDEMDSRVSVRWLKAQEKSHGLPQGADLFSPGYVTRMWITHACPYTLMHTGTCRDIKNPCEVRSTRLRLSTVSRTSQLSLTVSLASTTTTTNHLALPCPALAFSPLAAVCPGLLLLALWASSAFMCVHFNLRWGQCTQFGAGGLFLFFQNALIYLSPPFLLFPPVFLPLSLVLVQYVSLRPGGLWACG